MSKRRNAALRAYWSKPERDIMYWHDKHAWDGHLMHHHLSPLAVELEKRGFDITTFRFSILRKKGEPTP